MNYLDEDEFDKYPINPRKSHHKPKKPQQTQMDEYVFKARRIDKGSREFGLRTTHEPKRGSKKKRQSIDALEVPDDVAFLAKRRKSREKRREEVEEEVENRRVQDQRMKNEPTIKDDLDYSLAFQSPSPRRVPIRRNMKITKFMESPKMSKINNFSAVTSNNPSAYISNQNDDFPLDQTIDSTINSLLKTPPRGLIETVPMCTPSPIGKRKFHGKIGEMGKKEPVVFKWDSWKKKEMVTEQSTSYRKTDKKSRMIPQLGDSTARASTSVSHQQYTKQPKKGRFIPPIIWNTSSSAPEQSSSFQYTPDDDCEILEKPRHHRNALSAEETKREEFGRHATDRSQMMRQLIDPQFLAQRQNGARDARKAELRDGDVVRNKEMRRNLMHGAACKCCRGYYDGLAMEETEKKDYIDRISRHRYVNQPLPDTPERYWDLTLGPCDDDLEIPEAEREWGPKETQTEKKKSRGIQNWE